MLDVAFVTIVIATIGFVLCKAYVDFKHDVENHFKEEELMVTFDKEKAKEVELKTRK